VPVTVSDSVSPMDARALVDAMELDLSDGISDSNSSSNGNGDSDCGSERGHHTDNREDAECSRDSLDRTGRSSHEPHSAVSDEDTDTVPAQTPWTEFVGPDEGAQMEEDYVPATDEMASDSLGSSTGVLHGPTNVPTETADEDDEFSVVNDISDNYGFGKEEIDASVVTAAENSFIAGIAGNHASLNPAVNLWTDDDGIPNPADHADPAEFVNRESGSRKLTRNHYNVDDDSLDNERGTELKHTNVNITDVFESSDSINDADVVVQILKNENKVLTENNAHLVNENVSLNLKIESVLLLNETLRRQCIAAMSMNDADRANAHSVSAATQVQSSDDEKNQLLEMIRVRNNQLNDIRSKYDDLEIICGDQKQKLSQIAADSTEQKDNIENSFRRRIDELEAEVREKDADTMRLRREIQRLKTKTELDAVNKENLLAEAAILADTNEHLQGRYVEVSLALEEANTQLDTYNKLITAANAAVEVATESAARTELSLKHCVVSICKFFVEEPRIIFCHLDIRRLQKRMLLRFSGWRGS
jgi:hypothetical protein